MSKKLVSLLLAITLVMTLLPVGAMAATAESLVSTINSYSTTQSNNGATGTGLVATLTDAVTVTVTGDLANVNGPLTLDIDADVTVVWNATLEGTSSSFSAPLINLVGSGTLKIENGGTLTSSNNDAAVESYSSSLKVEVGSGGTVRNASEGSAIRLADSPLSEVVVSGGTVQAVGNAIYSNTGTVTVTSGFVFNTGSANVISAKTINIQGGAVSAAAGRAINASSSGSINISGGTVSTKGTAYPAINAGTTIAAAITVSGGMVTAAGNTAIKATNSGSSVSVSGGAVLACASSTSTVIEAPSTVQPTGNGVVLAWNKAAAGATPSYTAGDAAHIDKLPATATAEWGRIDNESGISYANGSNTGFIALTGVNVMEPAPATYTITYDPNGGSGIMAAETAYEGTPFQMPASDFTPPTGKRFKEWSIGLADSVIRKNPLDEVTFGDDTTVYAVWEDIPAQLTAPVITTQPENRSVPVGHNPFFRAEATGNPAPAYLWQVSADSGATWSPLSGETDADLVIFGATLAHSGRQYRCVVFNSEGTVVSHAVTLTVTQSPSPAPDNAPDALAAPTPPTVYNDPSVPKATVWLSGKGLSQGDSLITAPLTSGGDHNAIIKLADSENILHVYDISLKSGKTATGEAMTLTFDLGKEHAGQSLTLVHKKADGTLEYFYAVADASGKVSFGPLYELSPFMLVKGTLHAASPEVPNTGEGGSSLWFALTALGAAGILLLLRRRKDITSAAYKP